MCSCTENEANHYGRFLNAVLETVMRWHKDKAIFDKECSEYPGFVTKFCETNPVHVDYENYRHVCHKWHYRLTKAFILCLDSEDYIQIRNSLLVLTKITTYFPIITNFAQALEKRVDTIRTKEKDNRKDLYALATGFSGQLKLKKSSFVAESEFHIKEAKPAPPQAQVKQETVTVKQEQGAKQESSSKTEAKSESSRNRRAPSTEKQVKRLKSEKPAENGNGHSHVNNVQIKKESKESSKTNSSSSSNKDRAISRTVKVEPIEVAKKSEGKSSGLGKKLFEQLKSSATDRTDGKPRNSRSPPSNRNSPSPKKRKRVR